MAFGYIEAVYDLPDLTASECAVLAYLANRSNADGRCWPTRSTIANAVRLRPDTVKDLLAGLAERGIIGKTNRTEGGRIVSADIQLLFPPKERGVQGRGVKPPNDGGFNPPRGGGDKPPEGGGAYPPEGGGAYPPEKNLHRNHQDSPLKAPKGAVPDSVVKFSEQVWAETPKIARQRSGMADLTRALNAAITDRGAEPADILASLRAYWREDGARDGGQHLRGVHRMIQQDRWREWTPDEDEDADGPAPASDPFHGMGEAGWAAYLEKVWVDRLAEFRRMGRWNHGLYGPEPGKIGCQAPPHLLAELQPSPQQ